ncbi:hypothetical protein [Pimelobacter simplex]|uniref:hypothetical protein n=1 Tax=Nocardioides simplex TaxID=2045 RepID=UPI003AAD2FFC
MTAHTNVAHDSGKRRVTERQQPRRSKRDASEHVDKYADDGMAEKLAALAEHFNGGRQ